VRVRHYDGETARMVALDAWGVHVITGASDAGVTLGRSQRTYVFAKEGEPGAAFPLAEMPSRARLRESTGDDVGRLRDLGPPLATIVRTSGLALQTGGSRAGLLLGARLRAALRLPADGSRVLYLSYRAGRRWTASPHRRSQCCRSGCPGMRPPSSFQTGRPTASSCASQSRSRC
jgi:hypothetical protein